MFGGIFGSGGFFPENEIYRPATRSKNFDFTLFFIGQLGLVDILGNCCSMSKELQGLVFTSAWPPASLKGCHPMLSLSS